MDKPVTKHLKLRINKLKLIMKESVMIKIDNYTIMVILIINKIIILTS